MFRHAPRPQDDCSGHWSETIVESLARLLILNGK
jgi:hypothetical protein